MGRVSVSVMMCLCFWVMACQKEQPQQTAAAQSPQATQNTTPPKTTLQPKNKGASRTPAKPIEIQEPREPHYEAYRVMVGVIVKLAPVHRK